MRIHTNTDQLRFLRKMALELILAGHERECTSCSRSGTCRLQELAERFRVDKPRFQRQAPAQAVDDSGPALIRDPKKCVLCGECVRVCAEWQGIGALSFSKRGARMSVSTAFDLPISETSCVNCGQCAAVCPTGALVVKAQMDAVWQALARSRENCLLSDRTCGPGSDWRRVWASSWTLHNWPPSSCSEAVGCGPSL